MEVDYCSRAMFLQDTECFIENTEVGISYFVVDGEEDVAQLSQRRLLLIDDCQTDPSEHPYARVCDS